MKYNLFKKSTQILIAWVLIIAMLVNLCPQGVAAADDQKSVIQDQLNALLKANDTKGHWAEKEITDWTNQGLVHGYEDGTFRPNNIITRVEFVALVNGLFHLTAPGSTSFSDVQSKDWFAPQVSAATKAGYIQGYENGTFRPQQPLNRAEAAIILSRLVPLLTKQGTDPLNGYSDQSSIPSYSRDAMSGAIDAGYFAGFPDKTIRPDKSITRAEAVVLLDRILKKSSSAPGQALSVAPKVLLTAGSYGPASGLITVAGDLTVNSPGTTLQNLVIKGNLLIGEPVGEGDVYLQNVKVLGKTLVKGGGQNSIHIDNSDLSTIVIEKVGGRVRVVVGGTTVIEQMDIQSDANIESNGSNGIKGIIISKSGEVTLSGNFKNVEVNANVQLTVTSGAIENIQVSKNVTESSITLNNGVHIAQMDLHGSSSVKGKGTIDKAQVDSPNVSFEKPPTNVETTSAGSTPTPIPVVISPSSPPSTGPTGPTAPPTTVVAPGAPTAVSAVAGDSEATVAFTPPISNGGSVITGYTVTSSPSGITKTGISSPLTVTGLTNGTIYTFTVTATNSAGTSPASIASIGVTPIRSAVVPEAPTVVTAVYGDSQATISFIPPTNDGGSPITKYTVTSSPGGIIKTDTSSPITVTGLTNGTSYTFTVTATNKAGSSNPSHASQAVTPAAVPGAPGAPTAESAVGGDGEATISFLAPSNHGGSDIISYTVTASPGGISETGIGSPLTIRGLTNGTAYIFTVTATNAEGTSAASSALNATPIGVALAPTNVTAVSGDSEATITFTAPSSNGGSAITAYTVTSSPGGFTNTGDSSPLTVTGLTNGTAYTFTVRAVNAAGSSAASAASSSVIPAAIIGTPGMPSGVSAVAGDSKATIKFTPPGNDGGSPINSYTVTSSPGGLTQTGISSPIIMTGLANGTPYTFTVKATNATKTSAASLASAAVTPMTVPDAPTIVSVKSGDEKATIAFTAPANDGGSSIISYTVISSSGGKTATGATSPLTVEGLMNGASYTFTVTATNAAGTSLASLVSATVIPQIPDIVVAATVSKIATSGFSITLDKEVSDLYSLSFNLKDSANTAVPINMVAPETDAKYDIFTQLKEGETYSLSLVEDGYTFAQAVAVTVPVIQKTVVPVTVDWVSHEGFQLTFANKIDHLYASEITLLNGQGERVLIPAVSIKEAGKSYLVKADLSLAQAFSFKIKLAADKVASGAFNVADTIAITSQANTLNTSGFNLKLSVPLSNLTSAQMTLMDGANNVPINSISTADQGSSYQISASLVSEMTYTLTITYAGYSFGAITAVIPSIVAETVAINGEYGVYAAFNPSVPNLSLSNFSVTNLAGEVVPTSNFRYDGQRYFFDFTRVGGEIYTVTTTVPGYGFGTPKLIYSDNYISNTIINPSTTGFTLKLIPIVDYNVSDFMLKDSAGISVPISVVKNNAGASYDFTASLATGGYTISLISKPKISFPKVWLPITTTLTVDNLTKSSFTVHLDPAVNISDKYTFVIKDLNGTIQYPKSIASSDNGQSYEVNLEGSALATGSYNLKIASYLPGAGATFSSGLGTEIIVPGITDASAIDFSNITPTGFTMSFVHAVPGLLRKNIKITDSLNQELSNVTLATVDGGFTYQVTVGLERGKDYAVTLDKTFYDFGSFKSIHVNLLASAIARNISSNGLRLYLDPAIPGLDSGDVILKDKLGDELFENLTTSDGGASYLMDLSNIDLLGWGNTYSVGLNKPGYSMEPISFVTPYVVKVASNTTTQIVVNFNSANLGLKAANFKLVDEAGAAVGITSVQTSDGGINYTVSAGMQAGNVYWITYLPDVSYQIYSPMRVVVTKTITATITKSSITGFTLRFSEKVAGLRGKDLTTLKFLPNSQYTFSTPDEGLTYEIGLNLNQAGSYTVDFSKDAYGTYQDKFALSAPASFDIGIQTKIRLNSITNEYIALSINKNINLLKENFQLKNSSGDVIFTFVETAPQNYAIRTTETEPTTYYLTVTYPGYDFGPALTIAANVHVSTFLYNHTQKGFELNLTPAVADLDYSEILLKDAEDNTVTVDSAITTDFGKTYTITAPLSSGKVYAVTFNKPNYTIDALNNISLTANGVTIDRISKQGFRVNLAKVLENGHGSVNVRVFNSAGEEQSVQSIYSPDLGFTYDVGIALADGVNYTVQVKHLGFALPTTGSDYGADKTIRLENVATSFDGMYNHSGNRIIMELNPAVPDLTERDFHLTTPDGEVPILEAVTNDGGLTYILTSTFRAGNTYSILPSKDGYDFGSKILLDVPYGISSIVTNIGARVVDIALNPAVQGMTESNFEFTDSQGNKVRAVSAVTSDDGVTYNVTANFIGGKTYSVGIKKTLYDFGTIEPAFIPSEIIPTIVSSSLTGLTVTFKPAIKGLTAANFSLNGNASISSVKTTDGGASYSITAELAEGNTYNFATILAGYVFAPTTTSFHVNIPVVSTVTAYTKTGFTLQLNPAVAGLAKADLSLRDDQGQLVTVGSISTTSNGATFIVKATLEESKTYNLVLTKIGYDFGVSSPFLVPVPVTKTVQSISNQGFIIKLNPPVTGLTYSDLVLTDSVGSYVSISSMVTEDKGATYRVGAKLQPSPTDLYTLDLLKSGYDFGAAQTLTIQDTIAMNVSHITNTTFQINLSHPLPNLNRAYLKLYDESGTVYTFDNANDILDTSGASNYGTSYQIKFSLITGKIYTLEVNDPTHPFNSPIEVIKPFVISAAVTKPVSNSLTLTLGQSVTNLTAADISLINSSGDELDNVSLASGETAGIYQIQAGIKEGSTYTLKLHKKGYDFGAEKTFLVPIVVKVNVTNEDTNGFTITLEPKVANLDVSLKLNGQAVAIQSATTTDEGYTYQVKTNLGANTTHLLVLGNAGYDFGAQLSVSNVATLPGLVSAVTNETGSEITLNFDKPVSIASSFALFSVKVNGSWLNSIGKTMGAEATQIIISYDPYTTIDPTDTALISFAGKNTIKATNGTYLAAFSDYPVLVSTTPLGFATPRAKHDGLETARKLKDDFKLTKEDAAKVMRQAGFRPENYGRSIISVYQLDLLQRVKLFYDIDADGLTALKGQDTIITASILKNLVSVGYDATQFIQSFRALNYQSNQIALALRDAGITNIAITEILANSQLDSASKTVATLRYIGVGYSEVLGLLGIGYGLTNLEAIIALKTANVSAQDTASTIMNRYNSTSVDAIKLMYQAGYAPQEIGLVIKVSYSMGNALQLVQSLQNAGFNEIDIYAAASKAFTHNDVALAMLNAGISFGIVTNSVKASGDSDGALTIAYAFKQTGTDVNALTNVLQSNGYSLQETISGVLTAGFGINELAAIMKQSYGMDIAATYSLLNARYYNSYINRGTEATIFKAMINAGYDSTQLAKYYLDNLVYSNQAYVLKELKNAGVDLDKGLRIVHDTLKEAGKPLNLDNAFELFRDGNINSLNGKIYVKSDEALSAVLYAFSNDSSVTLDAQSVGLAYYKVNLNGWSSGFYDKAMQLKSRMGMTMQQWMELERSDGRVSGPGVPPTWAILRDTMSIFSSSTVTIQDAVNAMSKSGKFTLAEVISGIDGYLGNTQNVQGMMALLKNTGIPMQTILAAMVSIYGNGWIDHFKRMGLTASDVAVYYNGQGKSLSEIIALLALYDVQEIVLVLRADFGKTSNDVLSLLTGRSVETVSAAVSYIYREGERDAAVKLLKLQGYNATEVGTYLSNHNVTNLGVFINYLITAGFTQSEVTKVVLSNNYGATQMPSAIQALQGAYGAGQLGLDAILNGASITTAEAALEFLATHQYTLLQKALALKTVYGKNAGEATTMLNKRFVFGGGDTLTAVLDTVALAYSGTVEGTLVDMLNALGVSTPAAAIVTLRQLGYDKVSSKLDLTVVVRLLKTLYSLDAGQATEALLKDASYALPAISAAIVVVYNSSAELSSAAKLLIDNGITTADAAVYYLFDKYVNIDLVARVQKEVYHVSPTEAISNFINRNSKAQYRTEFILQAVSKAYGEDPLIGYLGSLKLRGADAYTITNELDRLNRITGHEGHLYLIDTLKSLGYDKESIMYEIINRFKKNTWIPEMAQYFVKAGFTDPTSIAKQLAKNYIYNPNMGYDPVAIELASLPNATLGSIATALKSAGFTGVAIIGGFIGNEKFDNSVAMLLRDFGFNARDAADNLHRARYSTENAVIALKALGYPLSEFFNFVNDNSTSNKVAILKRNGYSAVEIAKGLYANNTVDYWLIQALDQGGFTDLPTLLAAYYQSGQPRFWTLKDLYTYGRTYGPGAPAYRWQLIDIVKELQKIASLSLVDLTDLINYANDNNYNQTFLIIREISTKEQDELRAEIPFDFEGTLGAFVPNFIALGVMKSNGRSPAQAANILKFAGGVSDWKIAALNIFMSGYNIMDSIDALFNTYRTEIGMDVLMALFSSGFGQLIKDFDKYFKIVKFIVKLAAMRI